MRKTKKVLSIVLSIAMLIALLPVNLVEASEVSVQTKEVAVVSETNASDYWADGMYSEIVSVGETVSLAPNVYCGSEIVSVDDEKFSFKWHRGTGWGTEWNEGEMVSKEYPYTFEVTEKDFNNNLNDYVYYVCYTYYEGDCIGLAFFRMMDKDNYYRVTQFVSRTVALGKETTLEFSMEDYDYQTIDINNGEFSFEWYKGDVSRDDFAKYDEEKDGKLLGNGSTYTIDSTVLEDYYSYLNGYKRYYCKIFKGDLFIDVVYYYLECDEIKAYKFNVSAQDYDICVAEGDSAAFIPEIYDADYNFVDLADSRFTYQWYKVNGEGKKNYLLCDNSIYEMSSVEIENYTNENEIYKCEVYVDGYCVGDATFKLSIDSGYSVESKEQKAEVGKSVILTPSVENKQTQKYVTEFDEKFSFKWYRENDSTCIGEDDKYIVATVEEEDYSYDNQYYCKVFYKGIYIGESYITIRRNYTVYGQTYYRNIGESVTLTPTIYKGDYTFDENNNIVGELADLDDPYFRFTWIKRGEILSTESSYTIENLTEGDMNNDSEGYCFICMVYYKDSYVGTANINIVSKNCVDDDEETTSQQNSDNVETDVTTTQNVTIVDKTTSVADNNKSTKPTTTVAQNNNLEQTTSIAETKTVGKANVNSATKKRATKKVSLKLKKVDNAVGYQVAIYGSKKNANKNKKAIAKTNVKKVNAVVKSKKLKNKKQLFVRVRAYILDSNKKKIYGKWSKVKKVKIKK